MQPSILVLGGTRYVGKQLVANLRKKNWKVTIATRGRAALPLDDGIRWLGIDRFDGNSLEKALNGTSWDVVYDQLCYAPSDAMDVLRILGGRVGHYIMASSQMVYEPGQNLSETAIDLRRHPLQLGRRDKFAYGEGKRLAEAVLLQKAAFPVSLVRFPVILGLDDYTDRLGVQIRRVCQTNPLPIGDQTVTMSLISSSEAAAFLAWLGEQKSQGAINASSIDAVSIAAIVELIEGVVNRKALVVAQPDDAPFTYGLGKRSLWIQPKRNKQVIGSVALLIGCRNWCKSWVRARHKTTPPNVSIKPTCFAGA